MLQNSGSYIGKRFYEAICDYINTYKYLHLETRYFSPNLDFLLSMLKKCEIDTSDIRTLKGLRTYLNEVLTEDEFKARAKKLYHDGQEKKYNGLSEYIELCYLFEFKIGGISRSWFNDITNAVKFFYSKETIGNGFIIFDENKVTIKKILGLTSFIKYMKDEKSEYFRGHADCNWGLRPALYRMSNPKKEREIIEKVLIESPESFKNKDTAIDKLTHLQHYGFPTRLLDLSQNPLVALYFACSDQKNKCGRVLCIDSSNNEILSFFSDRLTLSANLAFVDKIKLNVKDEEINAINASNKSLFEEYNSQIEVRQLVHIIRMEKPYFLNIVKPVHLTKTYIVHPKKDNDRIKAQQGCFAIYGVKDYDKAVPSDDVKSSSKDGKEVLYLIPNSKKGPILKDLKIFGIDDSYIYPEFDRLCSKLKDEFK